MAAEPQDRPGFQIDGRGFSAPALEPGLYLVATPIGNLKDVTLRALECLSAADVVYCEDTRITRRLFERYAITTRLKVYNDHSDHNTRTAIIERLNAGQAVALVSDAGMPLVSDPGVKLVRECVAAGVNVSALPGASATLTALAASGLAGDRFVFAGFVPARSAARKAYLAELGDRKETLILFETAKRLTKSLADMAEIFAGRDIAIARELTKRHEEILRGKLDHVAAELGSRDVIKGEVVIIIAPGGETPVDLEDLSAQLTELLKTRSTRDAADLLANATGLPRRKIYTLALTLSQAGEKDGGKSDDG